MSEITAEEQWAKREKLENESALLLGHVLFEFSRLDMNLGLALVWVDGGARIEQVTELVESMNLKKKLDELTKHVQAKLPSQSKRRRAYEAWIDQANAIRQLRNNLVHGRWGIDANKNKVVNVIGLPTSEGQRTYEYSIDELGVINRQLRELQHELKRLRENWPL